MYVVAVYGMAMHGMAIIILYMAVDEVATCSMCRLSTVPMCTVWWLCA